MSNVNLPLILCCDERYARRDPWRFDIPHDGILCCAGSEMSLCLATRAPMAGVSSQASATAMTDQAMCVPFPGVIGCVDNEATTFAIVRLTDVAGIMDESHPEDVDQRTIAQCRPRERIEFRSVMILQLTNESGVRAHHAPQPNRYGIPTSNYNHAWRASRQLQTDVRTDR